MKGRDWLRAIRRVMCPSLAIAFGAVITIISTDGAAAAAAAAVLVLDVLSCAAFLFLCRQGKSADEIMMIMTVLSAAALFLVLSSLICLLFSGFPSPETDTVIAEEAETAEPAADETPRIEAAEEAELPEEPSPAEPDHEVISPVMTEKELLSESTETGTAAEETEIESATDKITRTETSEEVEIPEEPTPAEPDPEVIPVMTDAEPISEGVEDGVTISDVPHDEGMKIPSAPVIFNIVSASFPEAVPAVPGRADEEISSAAETAETEAADTEPSEETSATAENQEVPSDYDNSAELDDLFSGLSEEEAAFWADFYIAGEDEFTLENGRYYLGLYVNDVYFGIITSEVKDGSVMISRKELLSYISDYLTESAIDRIFSGGGDFMTLSFLSEKNVRAEFIPEDYDVCLTFDTADMPVQILSIKSSGSYRRARPIADSVDLEPAVFSLRSRYELEADFTVYPFEEFNDSLRFTFSTSNEARLHDVYFLFDYSLRFGNANYFDFSFGPYKFYTDIGDEGLRLSWGNINTDLLYASGTSIGIRLEKDLSFASSSVKRRSHIEKTISIEKGSKVQILNEGREIFSRTLDKGNYRLTDFILYSGANRIEIIITPLDGSPQIQYEMDVNYQSSLLAPGELYFSVAAATERDLVSSSSDFHGTGFRIPWLNGRSLEYDFRNVTVSGTLDAGITPSLTMNAELAVQNRAYGRIGRNPSGRLSLAMTHANILGTTRYNLRLSEFARDGEWKHPEVYARINHQLSTGLPSLSTVNIGLYYDMNSRLEHDTELSLSLSGRLGIFNWNASVSGGYDNGDVPWAVYASISLSPVRNMRLSFNARLSSTGMETPKITGRLYFSYIFGGGVSTNASVSADDFTAAVSVSRDKHSFYSSLSGYPMRSPSDYDAYANYSYNGDYIGLSAAVNAYDFPSPERRFTGSLSLSTSSVFADGLMAFSRSIPSNYLLVKQDRYLHGNDMSIGVPSSSSSIPLEKQIADTAIYPVSGSSDTYLTVYSTPSDSIGSSTYANLHLSADGDGYIYRINAEELYSASGLVSFPDGFIWINGASPLYSVSIDETGRTVLSETDMYIFSDSDGRFVVSGLAPGDYAFDVSYDGSWILVRFYVESDMSEIGHVRILSSPSLVCTLPDCTGSSGTYMAEYVMENETSMTGDQFWDFLYPAAKEVVNE